MTEVGCSKHLGASGVAVFGEAEVYVSRRQQPKAGVVVLLIVPAEEVAAETTGVFNAAEALEESLVGISAS